MFAVMQGTAACIMAMLPMAGMFCAIVRMDGEVERHNLYTMWTPHNMHDVVAARPALPCTDDSHQPCSQQTV